MLISHGTYLKPSKQMRVLSILDSLASDSNLSQYELGRRLRLSGAMVNQYLRTMQEQGLVCFKPRDGKSFTYELTDAGRDCRERMFAEYSCETVQLYTKIKQYVQQRLQELERRGLERLVLFGAAETCEVVLSALTGGDLQILALLDNDPRKQGRTFHGHVISHPALLEHMECDAVVITSFGRQQEIFEQLRPLSERKGIPIVRM
ncbi:MAG: winged helix-turn-helix transcriptional regulator [Desulfovibrio sp.]|nr:winged helix-turn-helix transcriptional regulator [Desulfovibrio sp.]